IVNHILGGGSFTSRLYSEVREKRGLAYSVYSYLLPLHASALFMGGTQTRADKADETVVLIEQEIKRLADEGPTAEELEKSKSYLKGSYALNFDTSTKIAGQLVQLQVDELGIDYWERRNGLIDAVTLDDVKRVAGRLLNGGVMFTVVGRTQQGANAKQGG
ncbi:M16 family metallopeptidase, partial [Pseudorhodoplanes sp.]|uniref:M16 family metallopeptidase n=1 Tax=Pseudorhodoplanes sp. TaxID=1934341 RepID=UPI00391B3BDD